MSDFMTVRETAAAIMRFVRGEQGMTHDERAWFIGRIEPIIQKALDAERERICSALPGGQFVDPQWVADMVRGNND